MSAESERCQLVSMKLSSPHITNRVYAYSCYVELTWLTIQYRTVAKHHPFTTTPERLCHQGVYVRTSNPAAEATAEPAAAGATTLMYSVRFFDNTSGGADTAADERRSATMRSANRMLQRRTN